MSSKIQFPALSTTSLVYADKSPGLNLKTFYSQLSEPFCNIKATLLYSRSVTECNKLQIHVSVGHAIRNIIYLFYRYRIQQSIPRGKKYNFSYLKRGTKIHNLLLFKKPTEK